MKALNPNKNIVMQFVGFKSMALVREYTFTVRESTEEAREFTVSIAQESFGTRQLRFQDAPDVCSIRLRSELAAHENHPPESHFKITDEELESYRRAHAPARRGPFSRTPLEK